MKLNLMEKKAFFGLVILSGLFATIFFVIGKRNLWFEPKNTYTTVVSNANGLREGSIVTLSGLRVGEIKSFKVNPDNKIEVSFTVKKSLKHKVRQDSQAKIFRAFIIGEKRIEIIPGSEAKQEIKNKGHIEGIESPEIADIVSGDNIGKFFSQLEAVSGSLEKWKAALIAVSDKLDPQEMAKTYQLINPTLSNFNELTKELKVFTSTIKTLKKDIIDTKALQGTVRSANRILGPVAKRGPLVEQLLDNINTLSNELAKNPSFASDVIGALKETTLTLKAIQKTWMLKDHVEELKEKKD